MPFYDRKNEEVHKRIQKALQNKKVSLNLSNLELTKIPDELSKLPFLTVLNLSYNKISKIQNLDFLVNLERLDLDSNKIEKIENISSLKKLKSINVSNNRLSQLTSINILTELEHISAFGNKIDFIEDFNDMGKLKTLDLGENCIHNLNFFLPLLSRSKNPFMFSFDQVPFEYQIGIRKNKLNRYIEKIILKGRNAVITHYKDIEKYGSGKLLEAKLLIIGEPKAGKTTLKKKLLDRNYKGEEDKEIKETLGVDIHKGWKFPYSEDNSVEFRCNIWDFGGQDRQYPLHQYFLTERAIYALVSDDRADNRSKDNWFSMYDLLGSESSKLIFILNQIKRTSAVSNFNKEKYEKLLNFEFDDYSLDLLNDANRLEELTLAIQKSLSTLSHIGEELPAYCITIRDALEKLDKNYITYDEYEVICEENGLIEEEACEEEGPQRRALRYLNDVGSVVYYKNDTNLADIIILNPHWVIDAIYPVITNKDLEDNQGRFDKQWLFEYWKQGFEREDGLLAKYKRSECNYLLQLMLKDNFDICYALKGSQGQKYLLPLCMPENLPKHEFDEKGSLQLLFKYDVMPPGLVTRLIVRLSDDVDGDLVCKNAVILKNNKKACQAKIEDYKIRQDANHYIRIIVIGEGNRKSYLERIKDELLDIQKDWFKNLPYEELIPCNCLECLKKDTPQGISLNIVQKRLNKEKDETQCPSGNDVNIYQLLGEVYRGIDKNVDSMDKLLEVFGNLTKDQAVNIITLTGNNNRIVQAVKDSNLNP